MKQLKSTSSDLRDLFTKNITVLSVAEPLASLDDTASAQEVKRFMEARQFDVIGVQREGAVIGIAFYADLKDGYLADHACAIEGQALVSELEPLARTFSMMAQHDRLFVRSMGKVHGIVTRGDMRKIPVRMWLFGLISLIEMQLLRLIREAYQDESWKTHLTCHRMEKALAQFASQQRDNNVIDLADCLQFCDKSNIIVKSDTLLPAIGFGSRRDLEKLLKKLERIRNKLAHAQDVIGNQLPDVIALAEQAERLLGCCEKATPSR